MDFLYIKNLHTMYIMKYNIPYYGNRCYIINGVSYEVNSICFEINTHSNIYDKSRIINDKYYGIHLEKNLI
jgi:hypothetical protein